MIKDGSALQTLEKVLKKSGIIDLKNFDKKGVLL